MKRMTVLGTLLVVGALSMAVAAQQAPAKQAMKIQVNPDVAKRIVGA